LKTIQNSNLQDTYQHKGLRKQLINLLKEKGISDANVLEAMSQVPRHLFVDKSFENQAYKDIALRIDAKQTISQPYTVAYQTEFLSVDSSMNVLEIGSGSGYQAAILSKLSNKVYTVERFELLYKKAKKLLAFLDCDNVYCFYKDGFDGLSEFAPYDRIIVTAAAPEVPEILLSQLKVGGRMVIPVNKTKAVQKMLMVQKNKDKTVVVEGPEFRFVPMLSGIAVSSNNIGKLNTGF